MSDFDARIVIHHVGGRGGGMPLRVPHGCQDSVVIVLYDADLDCLEQMGENASRHLGETVVFPYFLGRRPGRSVIHINYDPYTSSAGEVNPRYAEFYMVAEDHDYIIGEVFEPVETREIEVTTLDDVVASGENSIPPPDFFSMDVCGMGHDIFLGARKTLGTEVLGVIDNMFLHPIHRGQKLLHDHCRLLDDLGVDFAGFETHQEYSPHRAPIGQRGKGYMLGADTVFLRRPETLEILFPDYDQR